MSARVASAAVTGGVPCRPMRSRHRCAVVLALCAWVVPAAAEPVSPETRAAIDTLLARMTGAVLAADREQYLAQVWDGDAVFRVEQEHWADDLARHQPTAFELYLIDDQLETDGPATTGRVRMVWQMADWTFDRSVEFRARFVADAAGSWRYAGRAWSSAQADDLLVYHDPAHRAEAELILRAVPAIRAHIEDGFELQLPGPLQFKLYPSMRDLQASIYLSYVDPLSGWNEPGESVKLLVSAVRAGPMLDALLAHELAHVATFELGPRATDMPWWVLEGVAELASEQFVPGGQQSLAGLDATVRRWARTGQLVPWSRLADFRSTPLELYGNVYGQGHHLLGFVSERWGRQARNAWLAALAQGRSLDEASRQAFGLSFDAVDAAWRASLQRGEPDPP